MRRYCARCGLQQGQEEADASWPECACGAREFVVLPGPEDEGGTDLGHWPEPLTRNDLRFLRSLRISKE